MSSYTGLCLASSSAIESLEWQKQSGQSFTLVHSIPNGSHIQAIESHPRCSVGLTQATAGRKWLGAIERPNIIQAQKAALEDIVPALVLTINPPSEIQQQFLEDTLEEGKILAAVQFALDLEDPKGGPGVYRRIDIAEIPFVRRDLAVGFHVPFPRKQIKLLLREGRVDDCQGYTVERGIPSSKERIFPS